MKNTLIILALTASLQSAPIALHPDNPHYFLFRDKPAALITSAEHYGAVLNLDFDFRKYLDTLAAEGMNYTRIFSGAYVEPEGAFKITRNTLAPVPEKFICPWPRVHGDYKFDLSKVDPAYFKRLKNFVAYASDKNIVVELSLFCPMYSEKQWTLSPMNAKNNVNSIGDIPRTDLYTLDKNGALLAVQENLVRTLVTELNTFDNLFFEIANEPYFGGITMDWQHRIADVISDTEKSLPNKHLIAQNIANKTAKIAPPTLPSQSSTSTMPPHRRQSPPTTASIKLSVTTRPASAAMPMPPTAPKPGLSSSPAAAFTTTSTIRSPSATRTAPSTTRPPNPAAVTPASASRSASSANSSMISTSST